MPSLDYGRLRFRAVVDWIECEVRTAQPTNAPTIRRHGGFNFVEPRDAGAGGAATVFRFRIQEPENFNSLVTAITVLTDRFSLVAAPIITGIEVSLDAYSLDLNRAALVAMVAHWYKFQTHPVSLNRRFQGRHKGDVEGISGLAAIERQLAAGRVIAIGNKADSLSQRLYVKTTDGGADLAPERQRARTEITMQDDGVPVQALQSWGSFKFPSLSKFFRYRRLKQDLDAVTRWSLGSAGQIGERRSRRRRAGGTSLYGRATLADVALNARARDSLRELSRRWCAAGKGADYAIE
jgi:hypothetical protein